MARGNRTKQEQERTTLLIAQARELGWSDRHHPDVHKRARSLRKKGCTFAELGELFGISGETARNIVAERRWRHLSESEWQLILALRAGKGHVRLIPRAKTSADSDPAKTRELTS